jgi:hypothetical protein
MVGHYALEYRGFDPAAIHLLPPNLFQVHEQTVVIHGAIRAKLNGHARHREVKAVRFIHRVNALLLVNFGYQIEC